MLHVFARGILICQARVSVEFNGVLKFAGTVKIRGVDIFSICKLREGGYRVSYVSTFKLSDRGRSYGVYIYYVKGYLVSEQEPTGSQNMKFLSFGPIARLLNLHGTNQTGQVISSIGILNKGTKFVFCSGRRTNFSIFIVEGRVIASLLIQDTLTD